MAAVEDLQTRAGDRLRQPLAGRDRSDSVEAPGDDERRHTQLVQVRGGVVVAASLQLAQQARRRSTPAASASTCATMPPKEMPTTLKRSQPRWSTNASASPAKSAIDG